MVLKTERLTLRPFAQDDFEAVHSWAGNPENTRYMSWGPNTEEQTRVFLTSVQAGKDFAVVLSETGRVIGSCGVYPDDGNDTGEIGWILHKGYWKSGYGTELGGELIRYGFEYLKLRRLSAPCAAVNYGSRRVMERNGMRCEATHAKAFWARVDKEWVDMAEYAILMEDYIKRKDIIGSTKILEVDVAIREKVQPILDKTWGSPYIAVNGKLCDTRTMPGYAAMRGEEVLGYLLYEFHDGECEIMVLESVAQKIGIASALIEQVKRTAKSSGVGKVIVQTSNDNLNAFRFYQRRGFTIREFRMGALDAARQLKPSIPHISDDGIPLRDEIEFEILV